jgi:glycosyl transferase family 2
MGLSEQLRLRPVALAAADRPTVTVVIPCFNYARYLPAAVESALSQEGVKVDVVVVDDCSSDDSLAVARALAEHPDVKVVAHEINQGPSATFNDGLEFVAGEFLVRLDADDMLTPGSLARAAALARCHPNVGLVYGNPIHFTDEPAPPSRSRVRSWTVWPGRHWLADRCRTGVNVITSAEAFMRTSVVNEVGGQEPLPYTHDMEMWFRMAAFADVARVNGPDQAWHRDHPASLTERTIDSDLTNLRHRRAAFGVLFSGPVGSIPEAPALERLAGRAMAREALRAACHLYDRGRATPELVAPLTEFAREVAPVEAVSSDWRRLERRAALGPERVRRRPWYLTGVVRQRLEHRMNARLYARTGSYGRSLGARNFGKV